ncbi:TPA: MAPEG family protein [Pseudomonas aeruginosa]
MTIAFWCVLIAIFLPYVCTSIAKFGGEGYGGRANADPRAFLGSLEGFRRRANNAQLNAFEVTPAFAAAVIIAHLVGNASQATLDSLAITWITSRLLYVICYLADWGPLRSLVWFVGMLLIAAFFVVSA